MQLGKIILNNEVIAELKADDTSPAYNNVTHSNALNHFKHVQNWVNVKVEQGMNAATIKAEVLNDLRGM